MPSDLKTQVRDYAHFLVEATEPVAMEEIRRRTDIDEPLAPSRRRRTPGWAFAIVAAAAVLVLVGGLALLRPTTEDPVFDSKPTTVPQVTETTLGADAEPVAELPEVRVLGPGSWSVAAVVNPSMAEGLNSFAGEVLAWDGVFEVAIAQDEETWRELTGFTNCPVDGVPSCGEGLVVLVAEPWISQVALRLESEFGMSAVTAAEIPVEYWEAYVEAITSMEQPQRTFDTVSLGEEIPLSRAATLDDNLEPTQTIGSISMNVELDVEGVSMQAVAVVQTYEHEYPGSVQVSGTWDNYVSSGLSSDAYLDASDQSVIQANLTSFTELDHLLGPRRVYHLAGLPLEAAVVATELADGTPVWQRPVDGMVLIVDEPGSLPERFRPFYDQDGLTDLEEMAPANPFAILDAAGNEIMRVEENGELHGDRALIVTDLRIPPIGRGPSISTSPDSSFTATATTELGEGVPFHFFAADGIAFAGGAIWAGTQEFDTSTPVGALYRLDPTTAEIAERIDMTEGVADLLVDDDVLWVLAGNGDLHRLDPRSGEITETIAIPCDVDDCFWYTRNDLIVVGDYLWLINPSGQVRIHRVTHEVEILADEDGIGGAMWVGEADGLLWSLASHDGRLVSVDLATGEHEGFDMHSLARVDAHESWATLVADEIWLIPCCDAKVVRFHTVTKEISTVTFGGGFRGVVADGLWTVGQDHIERIDTKTGVLTDSLVVEGLVPRAIVADDSGAVWVADEDAMIRIDASTRQITDIIEVAGGVQLLAVDGVVWVAGEDGTVSRIERG